MKNLFIRFNIYTTPDIQKHYESHKENKDRAFWFSPGALAFFNSKIDSQVYCDRDLFYFISSEKFDHTTPREYSIRSYNPVTGGIDTVGEFRGYKTKTEAKNAIKKFKGIIK